MAGKRNSEGGQDQNPSEPAVSEARPSARDKTGEKAFDFWLRTRLHDIFDSAASESIPQDLMELVKKLDDIESRGQKT